ncbi:phosphoglycolate phosphatase [Chitinimonas lacunae]|uniref:Phosphoglycolate phosphatase n=1 Tax=Chitinimonas lacunae TaxID=1963018 RepID=A0ABV8MJX3_9NEIS
MTSISAVSLDLDGTLVDSIADLARAANAMREELGLAALAQERLQSFVGGGMALLVHRALTDDRDGRAQTDSFERGLTSFERHYAAMLTDLTRPYPGVVEGLAALHSQGIRLACVTNKPFSFSEAILQRLDLAQYFELTLGGDSLPEKKPSPLPLRHVCERFGIEAHRMLMVGDSRYDLEAARAAGCPVALLSYGYEAVAPLGADWIFDNLVEVADLVNNAP